MNEIVRRADDLPETLYGLDIVQAVLTHIVSVLLHFIVGMTNSAPLRMPVGQRLVIVLRWV